MKRIVCIFLPTLLVDLKRRKLSKSKNSPLSSPILLSAIVGGENIVFRYCSIAKKYGVYAGLSLTTASALAPSALVFPYNYETEKHALSKLAEWAYQFSPLVGVEEDFFLHNPANLRACGITLDISGSLRIFKGEENLITLLKDGLLHFSLQPRIAIAPSHGAAWALSRYHKKQIIRVDQSCLREVIKSLPVSALRLGSNLEENLKQLNIKYIADILKLPRKMLFSRFGPKILARIDEILGQEEMISVHRPPESMVVTNIYEPPLSNKSSIYEACSRLLKKLIEILSTKQLSILALQLTLQPLKLPTVIKTITLSAPLLDHQHILNLINYQLELLSSPEGFSTISIEAIKTAITIHQSGDFYNPTAAIVLHQEQGKFLDTLKHSIGENSIFSLQTRASYLPEKSFSYVKFNSQEADHYNLDQNLAIISGFLRPSVIFDTPQEVFTLSLLPDHPPQSLRWRSGVHKIIKALGPERISSEWWNTKNIQMNARDYFCLQLSSGTWVWAFRDIETSAWYIHGIWA